MSTWCIPVCTLLAAHSQSFWRNLDITFRDNSNRFLKWQFCFQLFPAKLSIVLDSCFKDSYVEECNNIQLFNGGGCNSSKYLAGGNGNDQVKYCTRPTAECNSSLDHFHYRRPNILNNCNHIHQITVLLPNHTFHEEIEHNQQTNIIVRR